MAVAGGGVADPICANEARTWSHAGNNPRPRNVVVGTLCAHSGGLNGQDAYSGHIVVNPAITAKFAKGSGVPSGDECQNLVAFDTTQITSKHNRSNPQAGDPCHPLQAAAHAPAVAGSPPLRAGRRGVGGNDSRGQGALVAGRESYPAARRGREGGADLEIGSEPLSNALRSSGSGSSAGSQVMQPGAATGVRRLTPRECERLQGFPDDWTALPGIADSARYRMLGNAVAVPCAEWIGRRMVAQFNREEQ